MARTELSPQRLSEIIKKNKYTVVEVILETANGNAQTVLNYADSFMSEEVYKH